MSDWMYLAALIVLGCLIGPVLSTADFWLVTRLLKGAKLSSRALAVNAGVMAAIVFANVYALEQLVDWANAVLDLMVLLVIAWLFRKQAGLSWKRTSAAVVLFVVINTGVGLVFAWFVLRPTICELLICHSGNMSPTLEREDHFFVDRTASVKRWDIVTFQSPQDRKMVVVSRLVGLPGETIELRDSEVFVNGTILQRPVHMPRSDYEQGSEVGPRQGCHGHPVTLGPDEYFVLGDNPENSFDSRFFRSVDRRPPGAVPKQCLIGRARLRYLPYETVGFLR